MDALTFHWLSWPPDATSPPRALHIEGVRCRNTFFTVRTGNGDPPERTAELSDDAAALAYACEIVRELGQSLAHIDRSLVKVRDETRQMVFSIPFLAGCA